MRDIRDDIADRFAALLVASPSRGWRDLATDQERNLVHALAAECIRQMEWARHRTKVEAIADAMAQDQGLTPHMFAEGLEPLTAAPDDWSVPKEVQS